MGIEGNLKQISPYLLEKLKKYPDFITVFDYAKLLPESNYWQKHQTADIPTWLKRIIAEEKRLALDTLKKLKKAKSKEYELIKRDIPMILEEGKVEGLELDKAWHIVSLLLTGYQEMGIMPFLVSINNEDNLPSVNAILCGTETKCQATYGFYRYLMPDEVKQVGQALSTVSEENIRIRFDRGFETQIDVYATGWEEDDFELGLEYCERLISYYKDAAEKGNAMLIWLS